MLKDNDILIMICVMVPFASVFPFALYLCWRRCRKSSRVDARSTSSALGASMRRASFIIASSLANPQNLRISQLIRDLSAIGFQGEATSSTNTSGYVSRRRECDSMIEFFRRAPLPPPPPIPSLPNSRPKNEGKRKRERKAGIPINKPRMPTPPISDSELECMNDSACPLQMSTFRNQSHETTFRGQETQFQASGIQSHVSMSRVKDSIGHSKDYLAHESFDKQRCNSRIAERLRRMSRPKSKIFIEDNMRNVSFFKATSSNEPPKYFPGHSERLHSEESPFIPRFNDREPRQTELTLPNVSLKQLPSPPSTLPNQTVLHLSKFLYSSQRISSTPNIEDEIDLYEEPRQLDRLPHLTLSPPDGTGDHGAIQMSPFQNCNLEENRLRHRSRSRGSDDQSRSGSPHKLISDRTHTSSGGHHSSRFLATNQQYSIDQSNPLYHELSKTG